MVKEKEFKGLNSEEVEELRKKHGYNELVKTEKPSAIKKFLEVFKEPMFLLLLGTAALYFILGEPKEAAIMLVFVAFVASITFIQEWKTERTVNSLRDLTSPHVNVKRDGEKKLIKSNELVPGDIIFISEGERIPADCEVLEASNFSVDESILTGEPEAVFKVTADEDKSDKSGDYWKKYMLYAGTLSIFGKCTAEVASIGFDTEYGKIGKAISETEDEITPLQKKTRALVKNLAIAGLILCVLVIIFSYLYSGNLIESILSGITLAMAMIPEEFPVVLTVFLSLGAFRLAKKNTLIRRIAAVETLGSATVLCVDKTGTITKNIMEVKYAYIDGRLIEVNKLSSKEFKKLMILSCEKDPYDPMEKAIVKVGEKHIDIKKLYDLDILEKVPFNSQTKRMANIFRKDEKMYVALKGAPATVLPLCSLTEDDEKSILKAMDNMADKGLRVLAFCESYSDELKENIEDYSFTFKGLVGLQDPPKEGVREAIEVCKKAGIRVVMITGDYSKTAEAIGKEIGLKFNNTTITGEDIDSMSEEGLCEKVNHCDIFSRVIPEHKMKIVKALKKNNEIVAMTGDGVNDAPALKSADIGIAMGKRGTEVAKEASHMILMDDNFTTIVESVKDGRRIFDNIRKAMVYILIIHIPIAAIALCSPIFNLPQILLPVHIVLLELIIDPTCSIIFEGEEAEPYIMEQPPRSPEEPLLTWKMTIKAVLQGTVMFLGAFLPFHYLVDYGYNVDFARSFSLMTLVVSNVILVLVDRSNTKSLFSIFREGKSKSSLIINGIALVMIFSVVYIKPLNSIFKTIPLDGKMLSLSILLAIISAAWWEIVKLFNNRIGR